LRTDEPIGAPVGARLQQRRPRRPDQAIHDVEVVGRGQLPGQRDPRRFSLARHILHHGVDSGREIAALFVDHLAPYISVPHCREQIAEPFELHIKRTGPASIQEWIEGEQVTAQATCGDSHPVQALWVAQHRPRVMADQRRDVGGQGGTDR
jgi:hypothetical protein